MLPQGGEVSEEGLGGREDRCGIVSVCGGGGLDGEALTGGRGQLLPRAPLSASIRPPRAPPPLPGRTGR